MSRRRSSPTTTVSARRHAEPPSHLAHGRVRGLADDDRRGTARLRDRSGDHRAAAQDRPVRTRVGGDEAAGEQRAHPRSPHARPTRVASKSISSVCATKTASTCAPLPPSTSWTPARAEVGPGRLRREREHARRRREAVEVGLDGAERRQHLAVLDRQACRPELAGERVGRQVAAVREQRVRPAGRGDLLENLAGAGNDVHLVAGALDERAVDVEDEAANAVKEHGATPRGRRPCGHGGTRSCAAARPRAGGGRAGLPPASGGRDGRSATVGASRIASTCSCGIVSRSSSSSSEMRVPKRARAPSRLTGCASRRASAFGNERTRSVTSPSGGAANSP